MRQTIMLPENSEYLYLIESNVGINKANKNVDREVKIVKASNLRTISISFKNNNAKPTVSKLTPLTDLAEINLPTDSISSSTSSAQPANHLAYINYQRLLVPTEWKLEFITYQNKEISDIDSEIIEINGVQLKQLGFLISLPEKNQATLELQFNTPYNYDQIYIQKQPGLPATNYILEYNTQETYLLNQNKLIKYP